MNTNTVNPEALTTEPRDHVGSPFGPEPQRAVLRRPVQDRVAAGVAAGLARYLGVDVMIVRIAFVVLTVFSGAGIPLYLAGLLLIPEESSNQSIAGSFIESVRSRPRQPAAGRR
jgi:phage shock protein PspC (stress-responsive transcriptional regulator)